MDNKFYSERELRTLFDTNDVHIIKDLLKSDFYVELKKLGIQNPDILIDIDGLIILADPTNHRKFIETNIHYTEYK